MIGTTLQDKYKVEKKIGEGAFAKVYRGFHTALKRPVAIKVLQGPGEKNSFKTRFLREAESMAKLNHPNIVTVYDYAEHSEGPYLVMEFVKGPTLLELVKNRTLEIGQVCNIAIQICSAMSYAHKQGIIHRDLTLRNIMINEGDQDAGTQEVKVLDFGLAKLLHGEAQTTGKDMIGTPYYLAPEQIWNETMGEMFRGEKVDGRIDIFAMGVGLYRMLNGRYPFEAEHPAALMYLIMNQPDIEFATGIPLAMKELILQCLEKDPRNRARSFDDLVPDLERIRVESEKTETQSSRPVSGLSAFADRSSKRNPYLNRVMIKHSSDFFGRSKEIRRIYSRLDAPHPQSISVVGERRIGKSSLLNYIYQSRNRRRHMQTHENAIFVYLDFQREADHDVASFIDLLFNMFSYESKKTRDYATRDKTLDQLKEVIHELHDEGKRVVFLMDEFEAITRNENFEEHFFSFLRSLANSYRVAYVTSSNADLQRMCHNKDISDSPFFNIFSNLPLRPFTTDEAMELITVPSETEGVPLEPHANKILGLAGRFPMFLQIACSNVFEALVENPNVEPDWVQVTSSFIDEVDQHYRFIWDKMDDPSRENLVKIASGKTINKRYAFANEELERRGYLLESGGGMDLCSDSFKSFVLKQQQGRTKRGLRRLLGDKG